MEICTSERCNRLHCVSGVKVNMCGAGRGKTFTPLKSVAASRDTAHEFGLCDVSKYQKHEVGVSS
jgi:hypothetical protein